MAAPRQQITRKQEKNRWGASRDELRGFAGLLAILSDPTRLKILMVLAISDRSVGSIVQATKLAQPTVSHHLGLLRMQDLISSRRNGKQVIYSLNRQVWLIPTDNHLKIRIDRFSVMIIEED